jgi:hypothetical protein
MNEIGTSMSIATTVALRNSELARSREGLNNPLDYFCSPFRSEVLAFEGAKAPKSKGMANREKF